jgi:hypothetical protein
MKTMKWAFLALTLFAFAFNSCKKSSSNPPKASNSISFKLNGTAYSASNITAVDSSGTLQVVGIINSTTDIDLVVISNLKVGSFDMASGAATALFISGASNDYEGVAGTLTITSLTSTTVAGTFSFTGTNIINNGTGTFTSGTFQTAYTTK